jgi:hypothetical protein
MSRDPRWEGVRGLGRRRSDGLIPATRLTERDVVEVGEKEVEGAVPAGVPTSFVPSKARPTHRLPDGKGTDVDRGGTIFDADDRSRCAPRASGAQERPSVLGWC